MVFFSAFIPFDCDLGAIVSAATGLRWQVVFVRANGNLYVQKHILPFFFRVRGFLSCTIEPNGCTAERPSGVMSIRINGLYAVCPCVLLAVCPFSHKAVCTNVLVYIAPSCLLVVTPFVHTATRQNAPAAICTFVRLYICTFCRMYIKPSGCPYICTYVRDAALPYVHADVWTRKERCGFGVISRFLSRLSVGKFATQCLAPGASHNNHYRVADILLLLFLGAYQDIVL